MSNPDIVIVKPGSQKQLYQELSAFALTAIEPPLWGALLAAYLRELGYGVALLDAEVSALSYEETAETLIALNPLAVLISVSGTNPSASTMNMTGAGKILEHLDETAPDICTVISGLHVTALPERTLQEERVDYVCVGEGFHTLPPLLDSLKKGATPTDIPGLAFRDDDGQIHVPSPPPLWQSLDELPMPAWDMLPIERYRAHNWHCLDDIENRSPYGVVYTSLGCPFKCTFCCINALFGKSGIRLRSAAGVIKEIEFLQERFGVKNIKIVDEMFALNKRHVTEICEAVIDRGLNLNVWAYARVNTVNREMLDKMRRAGVNWLAYGFESGSEKVLSGVSKGYEIERGLAVAEMTRNAGININGNFIFGLPDDDLSTMEETYQMAEAVDAEWVNFYSAMAYPGSRLYDEAREQGLPLPSGWEDYSQYGFGCTPLPTKHLSGEEVLHFRDNAFRRYYQRPSYLAMVETRFGIDARRHIEEMAKRALKRKSAHRK